MSGTTSFVLEPLIENRENKKLSGADDGDVVPKNKKTLDTSFTTGVLSLLAKQSCLLGFKGEERKKPFPWYKKPRQPCPRPLTFSLRARCAHLGHFEETRPAMQKGEREGWFPWDLDHQNCQFGVPSVFSRSQQIWTKNLPRGGLEKIKF